MTKNVAIIGSGNWGSCIAKICAGNTASSLTFNPEVRMWVFEETIDGKKLTDIINARHENVKYLPGVRLPDTVLATSDLPAVGDWADVLVFVLPHQFLERACKTLTGHVKPGAYGVSLIKGINVEGGRDMSLMSDMIRAHLGIDCCVLMGANLAPEVAKEAYCEATIGSRDEARGKELKALFQTSYFRLVTTPDEATVELCGALKNVVAVGAGLCDGLGYGDNTKAAVMRLGFMEMIKFIKTHYHSRGVLEQTFLESCGIADLITTCYGGRNRKLTEAFVKTGKSFSELEVEMLNGQKLQGPQTAAEVYTVLQANGELKDYPLMVAVHLVCINKLAPEKFIEALQDHPVHR